MKTVTVGSPLDSLIAVVRAERGEHVASAVAATLERFRTSAAATFVGVDFDEAAVASCFAPLLARNGSVPDIVSWSSELHGADLLLANRCSVGDARAIAAFELAFFGEARTVLERRAARTDHDEILQQLREKLFLGKRAVGAYTGVGSLRNWFRVALLRTAMNAATRAPDHVQVEDLDELDAFEQRDAFDAELMALKGIYREEFRRAFRRASESLTSRDRALLRLSAVDRLSVDRIAAIYGTHRATAARWLNAAKDALRERLRADLQVTLGVDSTELASILQLIRSNVVISVDALC